MQIKKKTAIVAAVAISSVAVGGAAWAYVTGTGTGAASATVNAQSATVVLDGSATITDLDTPVPVTINGISSAANRHIAGVRVAINPAAFPAGTCDTSWFRVSKDNGATYASTVDATTPFTFPDTTTHSDIIPNVQVQLLNNPNAPQDNCLTAATPTNLLILTAL